MNTGVTQELLRKMFLYNEETGVVIRLVDADCNRASKGDIAGTPDGKGYLQTQINKKKYFLHRLIWLYVFGEWPDKIDHINRKPTDNRLINLRSVTASENSRNAKIRSNNKSGFNGVTWHKKIKKWQAQIVHNNKTKYLGTFENKDDAIAARKAANIKHGFHENHGI